MESGNFDDARPDPITIAHWRELLDDETDILSDQDIDRIRQHADAMACVLVEIFLENSTTSE
jgi:hypothetical protein